MKIGFFITARLKSSRLKRKVLLDLNGKTILDRVIDRAKRVKGVDGVVLCTSTNPQDSELFSNALSNGIQFYAGSEEDVLVRLFGAARYYGYDAFLSITADNPLHSFYYGSYILDVVSKNNFDFVFSSGLPLGIVPYYIKTDALDVAIQMKKDTNTEIWGPFVNRPDFFNICDLKIINACLNKKVRLTCDYDEDYELLRKLYINFKKNHNPSIFEIADIINNNLAILDINKKVKQTLVSDKVLMKIREEFDSEIGKGLEYISKSNYQISPGNTLIEI